MKELTIEEKAARYDEAIERAKYYYNEGKTLEYANDIASDIFPEIKENEDVRGTLYDYFKRRKDEGVDKTWFGISYDKILSWLEKQDKNNMGISEATKKKLEDMLNKALEKETPESWNEFLDSEQKEINLVEILKHYPRETELYSPLYGKLWLAEVDEEHEIIICYKHQLSEGCVRAKLEQEDTVSFYSDGTTGLPDFSVSKDCMLFLYDIEKQDTKVSVYKDTLFKIATILSQYEDKDDSPLEKIRSIMIDGTICSMDLESKKKDEQKPTDEEMKILLQTEYEKGRADAIEQQKSAWSEDDIRAIDRACVALRAYSNGELPNFLPSELLGYADKLQSLIPQNRWKPSDEQMQALELIVHFHTFATRDTRENMKSLFNDLKKLRSE